MTSRSSIFNFETLSLQRVIPSGALFAVVVLLALEIAARVLVAKGYLQQDKSLRLTLDERLVELKADKPPVWFLGNSTLDWGVDVDAMSDALGVKVIKMAHGSGTVAATAAMLDFYIKQSGVKPKLVIVPVTKDDFNANGFRAEKSETYLEIARHNELPSGEWLMLRGARSNIRDHATDMIESLRRSKKASTTSPAVKPFHGRALADNDEFVRNLVTHFKLQDQWIADLKKACDRHQLPAPILVLMPVTNRYVEYHDRIVKKPSYEEIHQTLLKSASDAGVRVVDYWQTGYTDYALFRDAYHLSPAGKEWLTPQLTDIVRDSLPSP